MPIEFPSLPWHVQSSVSQNLSTKEYIAFSQSSKCAAAECNKTAMSVPRKLGNSIVFDYSNGELCTRFGKWHFNKFRARKSFKTPEMWDFRFDVASVTIRTELTENFCRDMINFFQKTGSKTTHIFMEKESVVSCTPEMFKVLFEVSKAKRLFASELYISPECIKRIPKHVGIRAISDVSDEDLREMDAFRIDLSRTEVSCSGVNAYLKMWREHKREIDCLYIHTSVGIVKEKIFYELDFNVVGSDKYDIYRGSDRLRVSVHPAIGQIKVELID